MSTLASVIIRDVIASRPAASIAGRLFFATDTQAMYRDNGASWDLLYVTPQSVTFASVPTPVAGTMVVITDSSTNTWGATVAGGGANVVLAWYNGTNWTVIGK